MSRQVTFEQLATTLNGLGFQSSQTGNHVIFRHPKTGAVLTVPNSERNVRAIYVNSAARQVANAGIATTLTFESKLIEAAKGAA